MSSGGPSVAEALARVRQQLEAAGCGEPRVDAEALLRQVLGCSRAWLVAHGDDPLDPPRWHALQALAQRRRGGEPLAHILGRREFWSMDLRATPDVLIPRADTELLVERALAHLPGGSGARVCDLGTGSGAVALAVARERPAVTLVASDASLAALRVAAGNARRLAAARVAFAAAHWLRAYADAAFDLIASNPPYIAAADPHLTRGDLRFEPPDALRGGPDGLDPARALTSAAPRCLRPGGWLLLEHGADQGAAVRALFRDAGFARVSTHRDLAGHERVTEGQRDA